MPLSRWQLHGIVRALIVIVLLSPRLVAGQTGPETWNGRNEQRDSVVVVTSDLDHFWEAFDSLRGATSRDDSLGVLQRLYLDRASPGLVDYIGFRFRRPAILLEELSDHPRYFAAIRPIMSRIEAEPQIIRTAELKLQHAIPGARLAPVYLIVGAFQGGGVQTKAGLIISADMWSKDSGVPTDELTPWERWAARSPAMLPCAIAHELTHFQQPPPAADIRILGAVIREGTAELIAERSCGAVSSAATFAWADQHQDEIKAQFRAQMMGSDYHLWLYTSSQTGGRPADVGYWVGYQIAKGFLESQRDRPDALHELLTSTDYVHILDQSGFLADRPTGSR